MYRLWWQNSVRASSQRMFQINVGFRQHNCHQKANLIAVHSNESSCIAHRPRIIITWSCLIVINFHRFISFADSFLVARLRSSWFATACSDNDCSSAGLKQMLCLAKLMAWSEVAFCALSCSLLCLGGQQYFGWADLSLHHRLFTTNWRGGWFTYEVYFGFSEGFLMLTCSTQDRHGWTTSLYVLSHLNCRVNIILASYKVNVLSKLPK